MTQSTRRGLFYVFLLFLWKQCCGIKTYSNILKPHEGSLALSQPFGILWDAAMMKVCALQLRKADVWWAVKSEGTLCQTSWDLGSLLHETFSESAQVPGEKNDKWTAADGRRSPNAAQRHSPKAMPVANMHGENQMLPCNRPRQNAKV